MSRNPFSKVRAHSDSPADWAGNFICYTIPPEIGNSHCAGGFFSARASTRARRSMQTEKKLENVSVRKLSREFTRKPLGKVFPPIFNFTFFARNEQSFLVLDPSSAPSRWVKDYTTSIVSDPVFLIV